MGSEAVFQALIAHQCADLARDRGWQRKESSGSETRNLGGKSVPSVGLSKYWCLTNRNKI